MSDVEDALNDLLKSVQKVIAHHDLVQIYCYSYINYQTQVQIEISDLYSTSIQCSIQMMLPSGSV